MSWGELFKITYFRSILGIVCETSWLVHLQFKQDYVAPDRNPFWARMIHMMEKVDAFFCNVGHVGWSSCDYWSRGLDRSLVGHLRNLEWSFDTSFCSFEECEICIALRDGVECHHLICGRTFHGKKSYVFGPLTVPRRVSLALNQLEALDLHRWNCWLWGGSLWFISLHLQVSYWTVDVSAHWWQFSSPFFVNAVCDPCSPLGEAVGGVWLFGPWI